MIEHLSAEQISQWMIGERTPELEQHVAECADCRDELEQMEDALSQFRTAMRDPANSLPAPRWREPAAHAARSWWPRLVLASVLLVAAALPVFWKVRSHEQAQREQAARADSQLLESVDSEISQAVPEPMEPLVSLVTWNSQR